MSLVNEVFSVEQEMPNGKWSFVRVDKSGGRNTLEGEIRHSSGFVLHSTLITEEAASKIVTLLNAAPVLAEQLMISEKLRDLERESYHESAGGISRSWSDEVKGLRGRVNTLADLLTEANEKNTENDKLIKALQDEIEFWKGKAL